MPDADASDLSRLHDIVMPEPVPWWPPSPGWLALAALALLCAMLVTWAFWLRWRHNAYRRQALGELARIRAAPGPDSLAAISELLKRTALAAYHRSDVAALTGDPWLAFLDSTGGHGAFRLRCQPLKDGPYRKAGSVAPAQLAPILDTAENWIRHHSC